MKNEPITRDRLSKLEPQKKYVFELKTGLQQTIYVTAIDSTTINGYLYPHRYSKKDMLAYSDTFDNILENVSKISIVKLDPAKTTVAIVVPIGLLVGFAIFLNNMGLGGMTF